jgi:hypothetical protein
MWEWEGAFFKMPPGAADNATSSHQLKFSRI